MFIICEMTRDRRSLTVDYFSGVSRSYFEISYQYGVKKIPRQGNGTLTGLVTPSGALLGWCEVTLYGFERNALGQFKILATHFCHRA